MVEVVPAIIPKSFGDLQSQVEKVAPFVRVAQIDIMDGGFAPEPSFPFVNDDRAAFEDNYSSRARVAFELDMMVEGPEQYFDDWSRFGIHTFILHVGSTDKLKELIAYLRVQKKGVALAFKPSTPRELYDDLIDSVDFIQCMGNDKIGYHGVELDPEVLNIVSDLRNTHKDSIISVDIGVNFETAPKLKEAGVSKLVSGSAIFGSDDIQKAIQTLSL